MDLPVQMSAFDSENPPDTAVADDVPAETAKPANTELAELRDELAKWRARVPKLANALKERSERVAQLEARLGSVAAGLDDAEGAAAGADAGNEARQELIAELEIQQRRLKERCHTAEAKIHTQSLELAEAERDIRGWREKWQKLTLALDEQSKRASAAEAQSLQVALQSAAALDSAQSENAELAARCEQLDKALLTTKGALADRDSEVATLRERNDQLFETTEFANDQISALSTSLDTQSARLADNALQLTAAALAEERMLALQTIEALNAGALQSQQQALERELAALRVAAEVAVQEQTAADLALSLVQQDHAGTLARLAAELEAQQTALDGTRDQNDAASQALVRAQQAQAELEEALRVALAQTLRQASAMDAAAFAVLALEEQLATALSTVELMRVQCDLAAANDAAYDGLVLPDSEDPGPIVQPNIRTPEETLAGLSDVDTDKLLLVLNQQLADARSENERLLARLRTDQ